MRKKSILLAVPVVVAAIALAVAGAAVGSRSSAGDAAVLVVRPAVLQGRGSPKYIIATDLPLQGAGRAQQLAMQQAVQFVLRSNTIQGRQVHGRLPGL